MTGYLELILGPMYSGKTTELIKHYRAYKYIGKNIVVINYSLDTRYSNTMLSSHDQCEIQCIFVHDLSNKNLWMDADVVLINEGQFFADLVPVVRSMVETYGKTVHICGLDGDFRRERFGSILDLIPLCDKVTKLSALCGECKDGTPAIFSHRVSHEQTQVIIGSSNYIPLCRKCYIKNVSFL